MKGKILLADDNETVRNMYTDFLRKNDYEVIPVTSGYETIEAFKYYLPFDLILLDLRMAHINGFEVLEKLNRPNNVPIFVLTANDGKEEEDRCINLGADAFISKTTSLNELLNKIESQINKNKRKESLTSLENGRIIVNHDTREVLIDGENAELTNLEFSIFECLVDNIGEIVKRENICKVAWGDVNNGVLKYLDSHVSNIRSKLKDYKIIGGKKGQGFFIESQYEDKALIDSNSTQINRGVSLLWN